MKRTSVAIMGANSHLAKSLINNFARERHFVHLHLFTLRPKMTRRFLAEYTQFDDSSVTIVEGYEKFLTLKYDVVVNCIGVGTIRKHLGDYSKYFTVHEEFDNLAISYLLKHTDTRYISLGSGSIYGGSFDTPANQTTVNPIRVNALQPECFYSVSRLYSEAKHRSLGHLAITDFRIFSFFSRFHDPDDGYLTDQIVTAIRRGTPLITSHTDFYRDYLHPLDLFEAVKMVINSHNLLNCAFDLNSLKPILKSELIALFSEKYGLKVSTKEEFSEKSATGHKNMYFSEFRGDFDFRAKHSSKQALIDEAKYLFSS